MVPRTLGVDVEHGRWQAKAHRPRPLSQKQLWPSWPGPKPSELRLSFPPPPLTSIGVISNWTDEHRLPPCTIFQAFKYYLDITTPPTPLQLQQFASLATSEKEKQRLLVLSKVGPWPRTTPKGTFHLLVGGEL